MPYPFPYLHFNALCMIFAVSAVVPAWIAISAGTSKQHWFWRALAIWAIAVAPIPMRGYELAGILAITLPILAVTIALLEHFLFSLDQTSSREPTIRFPLRDIFILTLLAALSLAAVLHWWRNVVQLGIAGGHHWGALLVNFALAGTAFWMLTFLAWLTVTRYRVGGALALLAAIPIFAYAIPIIGRMTLFGIRFDYLPPWQALGISFRPGPLGPSPFILAIVLSEFAVGLLVTLLVTRRPTHSSITFSRPLLAVPLIFLAIIYCKMIWLTPLPPRYSDARNNYVPIVEIMRESERLAKSLTTPTNAPQSSVLIREATRLLQADNYIPYDPVADVAIRNRIDHYFVDHHNRLRLFAKKIDDEAAAALASCDRAKALDCALANVRLGLMLQRGATYFDYMFGSHAHLLAQKRLVGLRRDFSPDDARRVIRAIDDAIDQAEDLAAVRVRSRAFAERTSGWSSRLDHVIEDFGLGGSGLDDAVYLDAWYQRRGASFRLLQTDLALRLYCIDHGDWPQSLNQLVPDYLSELPIDPHSGRPFIYRPGSDDFLLYSVGKDGIDNGGSFTNAAAYTRAIGGSTESSGYDFDLDALIRP